MPNVNWTWFVHLLFPLITPRNFLGIFWEPFYVDCFEAHNGGEKKSGKLCHSQPLQLKTPSTLKASFATQTLSSKPDHFTLAAQPNKNCA